MPRKNCPPLCLFAFIAALTLACVPLASATSFTIDPRLSGTPKAIVDASASVSVATCHVGAKIYSNEAWDANANAFNDLLPQCVNATNIGMLSQLLAMLNGGVASEVAGIAAGITAGVTFPSTAVVGSLCGTSTTCLASPTPVSTTPEPGTLAFLATGLVGLAELVRRRRRSYDSDSRFQ